MRTADKLVSHGLDIKNISDLNKALSENIENVKFFVVQGEEMDEIEKIILKDLTPFKGTMRIHHYIWRCDCTSLKMKRLTYMNCVNDGESECKKYLLGEFLLTRDTESEVVSYEEKKTGTGKKILLPKENFCEDGTPKRRGRPPKRKISNEKAGEITILIPKKGGRPRKQKSVVEKETEQVPMKKKN